MHLSSAALLLLLLPAARAAAIPNQGAVPGSAVDALANKDGHASPFLGTAKEINHVNGVHPTADGVVIDAEVDLATTKRDAIDDELANNIRKLSYQQIGTLVKLLKAIGGTGAISKRGAPLASEDGSDKFTPEFLATALLLDLNAGTRRDTTGSDAEVINIVEYVGDIAAGATGDVADLKNSQDEGTPLVPRTAAYGVDASVDRVAEILAANPGLSPEEVKALLEGVASGVSPKATRQIADYKTRGELVNELAELTLKANPDVNPDKVIDELDSMSDGALIAMKSALGRVGTYVKRDGGVVEGAADLAQKEWHAGGLALIVVVDITGGQNQNWKRDTTSDAVDATSVVEPTTDAATGAVGEVF
ncbi:hypothetical protein VE03_00234 [Pseudogymnoascus sp. 23342-1-I1]|nr:hypothetical protein VE03_00234 [Pseudogymnoascus sp. 23342-1-I1]